MVLVDGSATVAFTFLVGFFLGAGSASAPGGSAVVTDPLFFLVVVLAVFVAGGGASTSSSAGTRATLLVTTFTAVVTCETLDVTDTETWGSGELEGAEGKGGGWVGDRCILDSLGSQLHVKLPDFCAIIASVEDKVGSGSGCHAKESSVEE